MNTNSSRAIAKEVLRPWLAGTAKKQIARQLGLDPKTVQCYVRAAENNRRSVELGPPGADRGAAADSAGCACASTWSGLAEKRASNLGLQLDAAA